MTARSFASLRTKLADARVVFMGTPPFAVPSLDALVNAGAHVVGVITRPDKPAGRGGRRNRPHSALRAPRGKQSAIGIRATELGLQVFKPGRFQKVENQKVLEDLKPDLIVVVSFGQILPKEVLDLPRFGAVNVHASLLPKYRGPAPIPPAILNGDAETGVTIMKLDEGIDTGPILATERVPISPDDTTGTLTNTLATMGAKLLTPTLERYLQHALSPATRSLGEVWPTPQDDTQASRCEMMRKDDGRIDWTKPAERIARMVRAYDPWPRAFTTWEGRRLIMRRAAALPERLPTPPGRVQRTDGGVVVTTGEGVLKLLELQLEGRRPLPAEEFVNGFPQFVGSSLGESPTAPESLPAAAARRARRTEPSAPSSRPPGRT